jgi:hypothetical protein
MITELEPLPTLQGEIERMAAALEVKVDEILMPDASELSLQERFEAHNVSPLTAPEIEGFRAGVKLMGEGRSAIELVQNLKSILGQAAQPFRNRVAWAICFADEIERRLSSVAESEAALALREVAASSDRQAQTASASKADLTIVESYGKKPRVPGARDRKAAPRARDLK